MTNAWCAARSGHHVKCGPRKRLRRATCFSKSCRTFRRLQLGCHSCKDSRGYLSSIDLRFGFADCRCVASMRLTDPEPEYRLLGTRTRTICSQLRSAEGPCCRLVDAASPDRQLVPAGQDANPPNAGAHEFDEAATVWGAEPRDN